MKTLQEILEDRSKRRQAVEAANKEEQRLLEEAFRAHLIEKNIPEVIEITWVCELGPYYQSDGYGGSDTEYLNDGVAYALRVQSDLLPASWREAVDTLLDTPVQAVFELNTRTGEIRLKSVRGRDGIQAQDEA